MNKKNLNALFLTPLAIIFTIALTFASLELPSITDNYIQKEMNFVNVQTGAGDLQEIKTELFIRHYHLREIGYVSILVVIGLIIVGFLSEKSGLTTLGAIAVFLPVFGHFAATMFFLGGLGFLRLLWLPGLDIGFNIMNLGDAVYIPYRIIVDIFNLIGINLNTILPYLFIVAGSLLFCYSTLLWFKTYFSKEGIIKNSLYKYSRHPQYLGWIVWSYGIMLLPGVNLKQNYSLSDSLPWLLSTFIIIGVAMVEELKMSKKYGKSYDDYRKHSYFMLPFPKYICRLITAPFRVFFNKGYPTIKREIFVVLSFYFVLIILLTAILNYEAKMEAPGKWDFEKSENRTAEELVDQFVRTPERRDKSRIMRTLVNKGESSVPYFIKLVSHHDAVIREFSVDALGELKSDKAIEPLIGALDDNNWRVVSSAINSLGNYNSSKAEEALIGILDTANGNLKSHIAGALLRVGTSNAIDSVIPLAENNIIEPNGTLLLALGKRKSNRAENLIIRYLNNPDAKIRQVAAIASLNYNSEQVLSALEKAKEDENWEVRLYAEEAVEMITD